MCFIVDRDAPDWTQTRVWKVVTQDNRSPQYGGLLYEPGTIVKAGPGCTTTPDMPLSAWRGQNTIKAAAGIYVYRTRDEATLRCPFGSKVIELEVDPRDFLFTSTDGTVATYRKVTVPAVRPMGRKVGAAFCSDHTYIVKSPNGALTELRGSVCGGEKDCLYFDTTDPGRGWFKVVEKTVKTKEYVG